MSEIFHDVASIDYPIVDADSHVNEPPDLWVERVPARLRDRAPQVKKTDRGDIWIFDGGKEKWPVGLTAVAGMSYFDYRPFGLTYETMRPGSFDTKARLADMDADGIWAQLLYPSVTLKGAKIYSEDSSPACGPTTSGSWSSARAPAGAWCPRPSSPPPASTTPWPSSSGPWRRGTRGW